MLRAPVCELYSCTAVLLQSICAYARTGRPAVFGASPKKIAPVRVTPQTLAPSRFTCIPVAGCSVISGANDPT